MLPPNYQRLIESWQPVAVKPYLQAMAIPSTSRYWFCASMQMNGVIPYGLSMVPYWVAPRDPWSIQRPLTAPVWYAGSTRVYSGQAPSRGIYTGVRGNG